MEIAILKFIAGLALSLIASIFLYRAPKVGPGEIDQDSIPKTRAGTPVYEIWGRAYVGDPQVVMHGDPKTSAIKESGFLGIGSSRIGTRYYYTQHHVVCRTADAFLSFDWASKPVYQGYFSGTVEIDKPSFWGDPKREGGIVGTFRFWLGAPGQGSVNAYLLGLLGAPVPDFDQVVSVLHEQPYIGNSNQLRPTGYGVSLIEQQQDRSPQWYPAKAPIVGEKIVDIDETVDSLPPEIPFGGISGFITTTIYEINGFWPGFDNAVFGRIYDDGGTDIPLRRPLIGGNYEIYWNGPYFGVPPGILMAFPFEKIFQAGQSEFYTATVTLRYDIMKSFDADLAEGLRVRFQDPDTGNTLLEQAQPVADFDTWYEADPVVFTMPAGARGLQLQIVSGGWKHIRNLQLDISIAGEQFGVDLNAAHILRQCVPGTPGSSWTAAADTLFDEGFGLSFKNNQPADRHSFIEEIERTIDGLTYRDRLTGLWELKLIREEDPAGAEVFDTAAIAEWISLERPDPWSLPNTYTLVYTDYANRSTGSVTRAHAARITARGKMIAPAEPTEYRGILNPVLAQKVADRDLHAISEAFWRGSCRVRYLPTHINRGSLVVLHDPRAGLNMLPARIRRIEDASSTDHSAVIHWTEDTAREPKGDLVEVVTPPGLGGDASPQPIDPRMLEEAPYWLVLRAVGASALDARLETRPDLGGLHVAGAQPTPLSLQYFLHVDSGTGYVEAAEGVFAPSAVLSGKMSRQPDDIALPLAWDPSLADVEVGQIALIDSEYVRVTLIDVDVAAQTAAIEVARGVGDTVPAEHGAGTAALFWLGNSASDAVEYLAGDIVSAKLQALTPEGVMPLRNVPADSLTMDSRAIRPYPVGQLKVEAVYDFGGVLPDQSAVTWVSRDRTAQTGEVLAGHDEAGLPLEAGATNIVELRQVAARDFYAATDLYAAVEFYAEAGAGALVDEIDVGAAETWEYDQDAQPDFYGPTDFYGPSDAYRLVGGDAIYAEIGVRVDRAGYSNWQTARIRASVELEPGFLEGLPY